MRKCIRATDQHSQLLQTRYGLTAPQQLCLKTLHEEKSLGIQALSQRFHIHPQTSLDIVKQLEKRGLVNLLTPESSDDCIVEASENGNVLIESAPPPIQEKLITELSQLSREERQTILTSLDKVVHLMGIDTLDASPVLVPNAGMQQEPDPNDYYQGYRHIAVEESRQLSKSVYTGFRIRPAEWDDMETIARFIRSTADWYRPFLNEADMAEHEVDEDWKERNFKRREFFICFDQQVPIGTISIQHFGSYAYLGYIYLDKHQVGKRYGQILMSFIEQVARGRGLKGMILIAHPQATWAVSAYEKFGFEKLLTDRQAILEWEDGILKPYYEDGFHLYQYPF